MQERLLADIRAHRKDYEAKILASIEENIYQYQRYNVNFSLAIGATSSPKVDMQGFSSLIRETDRFVTLDTKIACVVFGFVNNEEGIKASSNLLSQFEAKFFSEEIFLSILNTEEYPDISEHINKLFSILEFSITNQMSNIPLDEISFEAP